MNFPGAEQFDDIFEQKKDEDEKLQWEIQEIKWAREILIPRMQCGMTTVADVNRMSKLLDHMVNELRINQ